jgi:hypothetical protein
MKQKRTSKARPRVKPKRPQAKRSEVKSAAGLRVSVKMVEGAIPYAEVSIHEPVTEDSMERLFESSRIALLRHQPRRILVDLRDAQVALSISDLNGLVKLIAASFAGTVERLGIVLRSADVPQEKFFEPSMIHRGMPTYVTQNLDDAIGWLTTKLLRAH